MPLYASSSGLSGAGVRGWRPTLTYRESHPPYPLETEIDPMASGPYNPTSVQLITAVKIFESVHVGAGANAHRTNGIGVMASLDADAAAHLEWRLPKGSLPSGTLKITMWALANATTGDAKVDFSWNGVAAEEDPSGATLNSEGTSTLTWASGDNDQYKELTVTLDASSISAGEVLVMHVTFKTASWTLAQILTCGFEIFWE